MSGRERVTVITGASKGIGHATARRLAREGHTIIGLARTEPGNGFPGIFHAVDLSDRNAVADAMNAIAAVHEVNGVVNNVGRSHPQAVDDITLDEYDLVMQLNLTTALQVTQAYIPSMKRQEFGRIVNIASEHALGLVPRRTTYGATKAGLVNFAREWTLDLASFGITANVVAPGPIETGMLLENNPPDSPPAPRPVAARAHGPNRKAGGGRPRGGVLHVGRSGLYLRSDRVRLRRRKSGQQFVIGIAFLFRPA